MTRAFALASDCAAASGSSSASGSGSASGCSAESGGAEGGSVTMSPRASTPLLKRSVMGNNPPCAINVSPLARAPSDSVTRTGVNGASAGRCSMDKA
ncbi:Uncharacterised protein [Bordetella pertussis]|nr:Uncharacterised protein [Bordetella pertussis]